MMGAFRRILTARVRYSDTRATLKAYALLWTLFVVGTVVVGFIQVQLGSLRGFDDMIGRYAPSVLGATIAFVALSVLNIVVNRVRSRR